MLIEILAPELKRKRKFSPSLFFSASLRSITPTFIFAINSFLQGCDKSKKDGRQRYAKTAVFLSRKKFLWLLKTNNLRFYSIYDTQIFRSEKRLNTNTTSSPSSSFKFNCIKNVSFLPNNFPRQNRQNRTSLKF